MLTAPGFSQIHELRLPLPVDTVWLSALAIVSMDAEQYLLEIAGFRDVGICHP